MDLEFISSHIPMYVEAAGLTVRIAIYGIIGALIVGLICSLIKELKLPVLKEIVQIYIELSRNTPLLIQLFFLYFGLPKLGIVLSSKACATAGLIFLGGSYMAEGFRTGIDSVPQIQRESAYRFRTHQRTDIFQDHTSAGGCNECSGILCEYDLSDQRNFRIQCSCISRPDVCDKGSDRTLL